MNENKYVEKIRQETLRLMANEKVKIYLFGSYARNEQKKSSDIDIAIEYEEKSDRKKIAEVRDFFEESDIPYRVDVVDMNFASSALCEEIRKDGILWRQ